MLNVICADNTTQKSGWWAMADAKQQNRLHQGEYTMEQKAELYIWLEKIGRVYPKSKTYLNYRDKFATIKVVAPGPEYVWSTAWVRLREELEALPQTVEEVHTWTGIIFRFEKV